MNLSSGADASKRHWFVLGFAIVSFVTALGLLFSQFYHPASVDYQSPMQWVSTWTWTLLELFPHPATIGALASLFAPWREFERAHATVAFVSNGLLFLFCVALGWALWRRDSWARHALATLCVLKIPVVLGNIAIYGQQFTFCAEGSIYPCSKPLAFRLLPYYGFPIAGIFVSVAAFVFLWRYGLEPVAYDRAHAAPVRSASVNATANPAMGIAVASRWIVVILSLVIAADYSYYLLRWLPLLLPRYSGGGSALGIRTFMPLIFLAIVNYVFGGVQLIRRVAAFEFSLIAGTALACVLVPYLVVGAQDTFGVPFLLGMGLWPALPLILLNAAIYFALIPFALVGLWRANRDQPSPAGSLGAGFLVPLIFVVAWPQAQMNFKNYSTFSRFPKRTAEKNAADDRQTTALKLLKIYGRCVFQYRQTHPGQGFPPSASAMGVADGNTSCLTGSEITGPPDGYQVSYESEPANSSGTVTRFHVFILRTDAGKSDSLGYFLDESGVTAGLTKKSISDTAPANSADSEPLADAPLRRGGTLFTALPFHLRKIRDCLVQMRDADPGKQFPLTAEPLLDKIDPYGNPCIPVYERGPSSHADFRSNTFVFALNSLNTWNVQIPSPKYRFRYTPQPDSSGARTRFNLTAKPVSYNDDGVRSYFIDEKGLLRATSDNREATASDQELAKCEYLIGLQCLDIIPAFSKAGSPQ
jgi:hypothetical protein